MKFFLLHLREEIDSYERVTHPIYQKDVGLTRLRRLIKVLVGSSVECSVRQFTCRLEIVLKLLDVAYLLSRHHIGSWEGDNFI